MDSGRLASRLEFTASTQRASYSRRRATRALAAAAANFVSRALLHRRCTSPPPSPAGSVVSSSPVPSLRFSSRLFSVASPLSPLLPSLVLSSDHKVRMPLSPGNFGICYHNTVLTANFMCLLDDAPNEIMIFCYSYIC